MPMSVYGHGCERETDIDRCKCIVFGRYVIDGERERERQGSLCRMCVGTQLRCGASLSLSLSPSLSFLLSAVCVARPLSYARRAMALSLHGRVAGAVPGRRRRCHARAVQLDDGIRPSRLSRADVGVLARATGPLLGGRPYRGRYTRTRPLCLCVSVHRLVPVRTWVGAHQQSMRVMPRTTTDMSTDTLGLYCSRRVAPIDDWGGGGQRRWRRGVRGRAECSFWPPTARARRRDRRLCRRCWPTASRLTRQADAITTWTSPTW
jgi:hypothetical protein